MMITLIVMIIATNMVVTVVRLLETFKLCFELNACDENGRDEQLIQTG